jgi:hypothetical protein
MRNPTDNREPDVTANAAAVAEGSSSSSRAAADDAASAPATLETPPVPAAPGRGVSRVSRAATATNPHAARAGVHRCPHGYPLYGTFPLDSLVLLGSPNVDIREHRIMTAQRDLCLNSIVSSVSAFYLVLASVNLHTALKHGAQHTSVAFLLAISAAVLTASVAAIAGNAVAINAA